MKEEDGNDIIDLTSKIVTFYISGNSVSCHELATLIGRVHAALNGLGKPDTSDRREDVKPVSAIPVRKSVTPDFIVCLEDGRTFKSLKRYLAAKYGMTPDDYRARWGLPRDYPMVAPNYAKARSEIAKRIRLNRARNARPQNAAAVGAGDGLARKVG